MKSPFLAVAVLAIAFTAALTFADDDQSQLSADNPLQGKVVIINPSSRSTPRANVRVENLGGKTFVVYPVRPDGSQPYEAWIAVDDVSSLRVFQNTQDAEAYLDRQKSR